MEFETHDALNRGVYANTLRTLISDCDNYKRKEDTETFNIAIDAPWGAGKTYFLKMFCQHLEELEYPVVFYSAWENDFWHNAFEPLANSIYCDPVFFNQMQDKLDAEVYVEFKNKLTQCFKTIGKGITAMPARVVFGDGYSRELADRLWETDDSLTAKEPIAFAEYQEFRDSIKLLGALLTEYTELLQDKKLIIIIDELDRCKPDFAIQTLEIVKHIFNVSNMVFVFGLDISQLQHAVKAVYGNGFDSYGYLLRFFNYYSRMPNGDIRSYISEQMDSLICDVPKEKFLSTFANWAEQLSLSFRDIDTIIQAYRLLIHTVLCRYENLNAYVLYLYFAIMKFKRPDLYYKWISDSEMPNRNDFIPLAVGYGEKNADAPFATATTFSQNKRISEIIADGLTYYDHTTRREAPNVLVKRIVVERDIIRVYYPGETSRGQLTSDQVKPTQEMSFNDVLFLNDLKSLELISSLTPGNFIGRQLETVAFLSPEEYNNSILNPTEKR